jgi:3-isopropylmalate dehydrogenase
MTHVGDLWVRVHKEVGDKDFPDIKQDYNHVDACTMWMVKTPEYYDVIVTANMFGDIITDLGAMVQGGMGIAAGGNINPEGVSMFEPIGGSAPKYTGHNVINPLASICAGQMMLETLGEDEAAQAIDKAVYDALASGKIKDMGAGKMGMTTTEVGDFVASLVS